MSGLSLRPAREDDMRLLWEWANEPATRQASFSLEVIPWEAHVGWFREKLSNPAARMYVAYTEDDGTPVAQLRFELEAPRSAADVLVCENSAAVSLSVAAAYRGRGYGVETLRLAADALFGTTDVREIDAYIKPDNAASVRTFARAGFTAAGNCVVKEQAALRMVLRRS